MQTDHIKNPPDTIGYSGSSLGFGCIRINSLIHYKLKISLDVIVEPDNGCYIARSVDLPLYGLDEDPLEALNNLKREIEFLYDDLSLDNNFTSDWLHIKKFLKMAIEI